MGQKVNPIGFRVGVTLPWASRWYTSRKSEFADLLVEDQKIRDFIKNRKDAEGRPMYPMVAKIEIERTRDEVRVFVHSARPGILIGRKGEKKEELQRELEELTGRRIRLEVIEVRQPELVAQLVAEDIADQLSRRASFRRTMKRAIEETMKAGAKGIKIQVSGRLGGAEMCRSEKEIAGTMPLSTLMADIDYGFAEALIPQGRIGVKVWINRGMFGEDQAHGDDAQAGKVSKGPKRAYKR